MRSQQHRVAFLAGWQRLCCGAGGSREFRESLFDRQSINHGGQQATQEDVPYESIVLGVSGVWAAAKAHGWGGTKAALWVGASLQSPLSGGRRVR
jgi:hypothetical protein